MYAHTVPRRGGDRRGVKGWKFRPRPPITHRASSKSRRVNAAKASKYARVFSRKGHLKNSFACAPLPPRLYAKWEFALLVFLVPHRTKRFAVSGEAFKGEEVATPDFSPIYFFPLSFLRIQENPSSRNTSLISIVSFFFFLSWNSNILKNEISRRSREIISTSIVSQSASSTYAKSRLPRMMKHPLAAHRRDRVETTKEATQRRGERQCRILKRIVSGDADS